MQKIGFDSGVSCTMFPTYLDGKGGLWQVAAFLEAEDKVASVCASA